MIAIARIRGVLAPVVTPLKLVHFPCSLAPTRVALPSMSLIPSAPFKTDLWAPDVLAPVSV